ncbi:MAG: hypothetical protein P4L55_12820 [Syntrophobacteraceae bacterium]|nr:hypothetical protein [Syntrophobacteraceae bacterium]
MGEPVAQNLFAGLDIGSHTTRLLIAEKSGHQLVPIRSERRVTRLAEGFQRDGAITEEAQRRNTLALKEYASLLRHFRVDKVSCGATGVVRRAVNSDRVLARIAAETGLQCAVLSEDREAALSAKGILSAINPGGKAVLMFDVGGGSTEFVLPGADNHLACASRPVGAATLSEAFLSGDPPGLEAVHRAAARARGQIDSAREELYENLRKTDTIICFSGLSLAGTAGTVTTLAAMKLEMKRYVPYLVNGTLLSLDWLFRAIESLAAMVLAERRMIVGIEAGREDIILGGAVIVSQILSSFGSDSFIVSDAGLLEGMVIELAQSESGLPVGPAAGPTTDLTWRRLKR